jgi:hypothetical protein
VELKLHLATLKFIRLQVTVLLQLLLLGLVHQKVMLFSILLSLAVGVAALVLAVSTAAEVRAVGVDIEPQLTLQ